MARASLSVRTTELSMLNLANALDREDELRQDFHASSVRGNAHAPAYAPKGEQR